MTMAPRKNSHKPFDLSQAHPDWHAALDAYLCTLDVKRSFDYQKRHVARRLVWHTAITHGPSLTPGDYTEAHGEIHRAFVRATVPHSSGLFTYHGARELLDTAVRLGLRDGALPNPLHARRVEKIVLPDDAPVEMQGACAQLETWATNKTAVRTDTNGMDGFSEEYARGIVRTFTLWVRFLIERNRTLPLSERTTLTLGVLFSDPEPAAAFLLAAPTAGWTREKTLNEKSRKARMNYLLCAYRFFRRQSKNMVGDVQYRERLREYLKEDRRKLYLQGGEPLVIEALSLKEVHAVEQLLARRLERARAARDEATTDADRAQAQMRLVEVLRARAIWELGLWSGCRLETLASFDLSQFRMLPTGSWVCDNVRMKANGSKLWQTQWVSPRAIRAISEYLEAEGRHLQ